MRQLLVFAERVSFRSKAEHRCVHFIIELSSKQTGGFPIQESSHCFAETQGRCPWPQRMFNSQPLQKKGKYCCCHIACDAVGFKLSTRGEGFFPGVLSSFPFEGPWCQAQKGEKRRNYEEGMT
jgi:hypothetical protein